MKFQVTVVETVTRTRTKVFEGATEKEAQDKAQAELDDVLDSLDEFEDWEADEDDDDVVERLIDDVEALGPIEGGRNDAS
jgi:hypothetical protein